MQGQTMRLFETALGVTHTCPKCGWKRVFPRETRVVCPQCHNRETVKHGGARRDNFACVHLYDGDGPVHGFQATQLKCGCAGSKLTSIWECEVKKLCAPYAKSEVAEAPYVQACLNCPSYIYSPL